MTRTFIGVAFRNLNAGESWRAYATQGSEEQGTRSGEGFTGFTLSRENTPQHGDAHDFPPLSERLNERCNGLARIA